MIIDYNINIRLGNGKFISTIYKTIYLHVKSEFLFSYR